MELSPIRPGATFYYDLTCLQCSQSQSVPMTREAFLWLLYGGTVMIEIEGTYQSRNALQLHRCVNCGGYVTFEQSPLVQANEQRPSIKSPGSRVARMPLRESGI